VRDPRRGRPYSQGLTRDVNNPEEVTESVLEASLAGVHLEATSGDGHSGRSDTQRTVNVVLSDMSAPWHQTTGFWKRSLSNPYYRMMNTSGVTFRDHAGSMVSFPLP
jgi:21S rRNA (uridine2791-2'-O)-methyltransferase